jgi:NAD(P)H-dependent FMN reductase
MLKIGIISGSTRKNRVNPQVVKWVHEEARKRTDASFEIVDIADYDLPIFDEPKPPAYGDYENAHTRKWAAKIASLDGFVFVVPEYNHGVSGALKNAIDFIYAEWNNKAAGFVSYGSAGGTRAVEHLRGVMAELQIADVRAHVSFSMYTDFENWSVFKPTSTPVSHLPTLLDQLVVWSRAMQRVREEAHKAK